MNHTNEYGQPVGTPLPDWKPVASPSAEHFEGQTVRLERLSAEQHADELFDAFSLAADSIGWTYLPGGPFHTLEECREWVAKSAAGADPRHYAVINRESGRAVGTMSLMRINPTHGVIEVGWVSFSPVMQRTVMSTEAHFLFMQYAFDELGYRRYEWKCDSLNAPSRKAAERLGFTYEGTFRQDAVVRGRSRDTAWFSILDSEWPVLKAAFTQWLAAENFDEQGKQIHSLEQVRARLK